jgi:hypothetical protein
VIKFSVLTATFLSLLSIQLQAESWSDTSIGYRYGTQFKEPYVNGGGDISKNIFNIEHVGGYQYGTNFVNLDLLESDGKDHNAQEAYLVYRNIVEYGKVSGNKIGSGIVRDFGLTIGFDWNTKNDPGYASKKRMFVAGPTLMLNVPNFVNISLLLINESNEPKGVSGRYAYDTHPCLDIAWGIPLGGKFSFDGYADFIASKGTNEFGGKTANETHVDVKVMYIIDSKKSFRMGAGYEYWVNKFGNPSSVPGSKAMTPMLRAEYHF